MGIPDGLGQCDPQAALSEVPAAPTWSSDVRALMLDHCGGCHGADQTPPALTTFADASAVALQVAASVSAGTMPPNTPQGCCQPYLADRPLTAEEVELLQRWADQGAPEGEATDASPPVGDADGWLLAASGWAPQWVANASTSYTPARRGSRDDIRCYLLEVPRTEPAVVTGFRVTHTSSQAVRSAVYRVDGDELADWRARDAASEGEGWDCYAGLTQSASGLLGAARADGAQRSLPGGVGRLLPADSQVVLLVQYATRDLGAGDIEPDQPRVELRLSDRTDRAAKNLVVANPYWALGGGMVIEAGVADVSHAFAFEPTGLETEGQPMEVLGVSLQMHDRGTRAQLVVHRESGGMECLLTYDGWDTRSYAELFLETTVRIEPGDRLGIECHWDHSGGSSDLQWDADEEVCLGTVLYRVVP